MCAYVCVCVCVCERERERERERGLFHFLIKSSFLLIFSRSNSNKWNYAARNFQHLPRIRKFLRREIMLGMVIENIVYRWYLQRPDFNKTVSLSGNRIYHRFTSEISAMTLCRFPPPFYVVGIRRVEDFFDLFIDVFKTTEHTYRRSILLIRKSRITTLCSVISLAGKIFIQIEIVMSFLTGKIFYKRQRFTASHNSTLLYCHEGKYMFARCRVFSRTICDGHS